MIRWPAVIKYEGDDELTYLGSEADWTGDADLSFASYHREDCLIDSEGRLFSLQAREGRTVRPAETGKNVSLKEMIRLVQAHASRAGECCIEKIAFSSIAEGVARVGELNLS